MRWFGAKCELPQDGEHWGARWWKISCTFSTRIRTLAEWIQVARLSELPPGTATEVVAGERIVALFRVEDGVYALDGVCPHQGGPLGQGHLEGCTVTCPWHGWQFDVRNGQHQFNAAIRQSTFPVRVEGDDIFVDISVPSSDSKKDIE